MDELLQKYGKDTVMNAVEQVFGETETKCRNVVSRLKKGTYEAESFLDHDGVKLDEPIRLHAKVTIGDGGEMTIDLSGCSPERKASVNSRTLAAARVAYKALTGPNDPVNEGSFRALKVIIPEGNIMMAKYPAPMSGWSGVLPTAVDTIIKALAPIMPDQVPAGHHGLLGGTVVFFGVAPKTGRRFVVQSIEGGGWGGRPYEDGEPGTVSHARATCATDPSKASRSSAQFWCKNARFGRILAGPANIGVVSGPTCASSTSSKAAGTLSPSGAPNVRRGDCGVASLA